MGLIKTKDALVRFVVINFLVIDFYGGGGRVHLVSAAVHHQERSISSSNREDIITTNDIDALLHQLKSELARDTPGASYSYCYGEENCTGGQYCNVPTHQCMCRPSAYVDESCPTVGHRCTSCCCGKNVYCTGDICQLYEMAGVSSQMILSIVMVTGLVSIIFMVYRMCYRNTLQQRLIHSPPRESPRPSLSSLQIGVMSRMRDRPPTYETRHNYQRRRTVSVAENDASANTGGVDNPALEVCEVIAPRLHQSSQALPNYTNTPPPPYVTNNGSSEAGGGDNISIASPRSSVLRAEPPPYSVAIKETSHSPIVVISGGGAGDHSNSMPQSPPAGQTRVVQDNSKELYI